MHAFDDGVGRDNQVLTRRLQDGGVVGQTQGARRGRERLEVARDQGVFGG